MESPKKLVERFVKENSRKIALWCASIAGFLVAWHVLSFVLEFRGSDYAEYIPGPYAVAVALVGLLGGADPYTNLAFSSHVTASLKRILLGFVLAFAAALPLGILMGRSWIANSLANPVVEVFRPIPPLAWIPIFLIVFKVFWGPVAIVFMGIFFPILLNVVFGARSVDPTLIDAAKTLGARKTDLFAKVVLPYTIPYMMTGVKVGLGIGWMCIVAAEMVAAQGGGLGYFILAVSDFSDYEDMYAGMVMIGILSTLTTGIAGIFEGIVYRRMGMR